MMSLGISQEVAEACLKVCCPAVPVVGLIYNFRLQATDNTAAFAAEYFWNGGYEQVNSSAIALIRGATKCLVGRYRTMSPNNGTDRSSNNHVTEDSLVVPCVATRMISLLPVN